MEVISLFFQTEVVKSFTFYIYYALSSGFIFYQFFKNLFIEV